MHFLVCEQSIDSIMHGATIKKQKDINFSSMSTAWPNVPCFGSNLALLSHKTFIKISSCIQHDDNTSQGIVSPCRYLMLCRYDLALCTLWISCTILMCGFGKGKNAKMYTIRLWDLMMWPLKLKAFYVEFTHQQMHFY